MLTPEQKADVMRFVTKIIHDLFKYQEAIERNNAEIRMLKRDVLELRYITFRMQKMLGFHIDGGQGVQQSGHH